MSSSADILKTIRKDIIDNLELAIIGMSVIAYYAFRTVIGAVPAAMIAITIGILSLCIYVFRSKIIPAARKQEGRR